MNEKKLTIILISSLAVIAIGGGLLLYWLEFSWLADLDKKIGELKTTVGEMEDKQKKLPGLVKENESLLVRIKKGEDRIPRLSTGGWQDDKANWHFEYDDFVNLLDGLRKQANVYVASSKFMAMSKQAAPGAKALPASVHKVTYDLDVKGTWYNLLRFIAMLESQKRVIAIEKFSFRPGTDASKEKNRGGPIRHDLSVRLISYTYRDMPGAPGASGSKPGEVKGPAESAKSTLPPD